MTRVGPQPGPRWYFSRVSSQLRGLISKRAGTQTTSSRAPRPCTSPFRAANSAFPSGERDAERRTWNTLGSVPAVRGGRVLFLFDDRIVIPGPRVVEGTTEIARALHPEAFK